MPDLTSVPLIPKPSPYDLMLRIERLRDIAEDANLDMLAYLLELARLEAERNLSRDRRD